MSKLSRTDARLELPAVTRLRRELRRHSDEDNEKAWTEIKAYLDRLANHVYRRHAAFWARYFGVRDPLYPDLIRIDVMCGGSFLAKHGVRRCLALAGLQAHRDGNINGFDRALHLILHDNDLELTSRARRNASGPRRPRRSLRMRDKKIRQRWKTLIDARRPPRAIRGIIAREFGLTPHRIGEILRKKADT